MTAPRSTHWPTSCQQQQSSSPAPSSQLPAPSSHYLTSDSDVQIKIRVQHPCQNENENENEIDGFDGALLRLITVDKLTVQRHPEDYPILLALRGCCSALAKYWHPQA
ncbi:hypothetical protein ST47_g4196 [Ascochyta rabiei]|uniref:Uncharacterized protein n=1 Tax=Didymella rabiei TaxID=5454 RepID=A0A163G4V4_DIDRA|nr:hypothetical protein ST47_g4196 [Ascochyta rabiei]